MQTMDHQQLITYLNAIHVGDVEAIRGKLDEAQRACIELQQQELADKLAEASSALAAADVKTYRRRVETVLSRLGHLK